MRPAGPRRRRPPQSDVQQAPVGLIGTGYLAWLSRDAWRASGSSVPVSASRRRDDGSTEALRCGIVLLLTNPQNDACWAAVGRALGSVGVHEPTMGDYGIFYAGFLLSSVLWAISFAALVHHLFLRVGSAWVRTMYRLCALAFLIFALASRRAVFSVL